jgi:hypothetical protein
MPAMTDQLNLPLDSPLEGKVKSDRTVMVFNFFALTKERVTELPVFEDPARNVSTILRQAYAQFRLGGSGFFCGGLIQTAVGLAGGSGGFRTKRLGLARKARLRVCCRAAWTSSACP